MKKLKQSKRQTREKKTQTTEELKKERTKKQRSEFVKNSFKKFWISILSAIALMAEMASDHVTLLLSLDVKYYIIALILINLVIGFKHPKQRKEKSDDGMD